MTASARLAWRPSKDVNYECIKAMLNKSVRVELVETNPL
jgi:hypothetical protein